MSLDSNKKGQSGLMNMQIRKRPGTSKQRPKLKKEFLNKV